MEISICASWYGMGVSYALKYGADPEEPSPGDMGCNITRYDGANVHTDEIGPEIKTHPKTSLMQEHDIADNHGHDTLISSCSQSTNNSSCNEARVAGHTRLPDICQDANQAADENSWTSPKNVGERDDDEVRITECHSCRSKLECTLDMLDMVYLDKGELTSMLTCGKVLWNS